MFYALYEYTSYPSPGNEFVSIHKIKDVIEPSDAAREEETF